MKCPKCGHVFDTDEEEEFDTENNAWKWIDFSTQICVADLDKNEMS